MVQNAVRSLLAIPDEKIRLLPQGLYRDCRYSARTRTALRTRLGIPKDELLLVGMGYGDLRKGFDLFLQLWRTLQSRVNGRSVSAAAPARTACGSATSIHRCASICRPSSTWRWHRAAFIFRGNVQNAPDYLSAADAFVLTSREDPLPSVVMEAMATRPVPASRSPAAAASRN